MSLNAICPIHDSSMTEREGQYGTFWSHKVEDPQYPSGWCNGKPPKVTGYQAARQTADAIAHRAPEPTREPFKEKDWSRVERQHSQEMSLRFASLTGFGDQEPTEFIKTMTDWFMNDLDQS